MKLYLFIILSLLLSPGVFAQSVWTEEIQPVEVSGYYNIQLGQGIIAQSLDSDLSDLKILDSKNNEVPYFLRSVNPIREISRFENYNLKQNQVKDSLNIVTIDNQEKEDINRFYIIVRKADVSKYASLRGSNDLKQWYIVRQKTSVSGFGDADEVLILDFPKGNYRYYEITLENNQNSPLEVLKVGKIKNSNIYAQFTELQLGYFFQKDSVSDKKTYITFPNSQDTYRISKLEIGINNKAYFFRHAVMSDSISHSRVTFDLSSKGNNTFFINSFLFSRNTSIAIENHNNPPLKVDSVKAYGLNRYVCAYLEEGQSYIVRVGSKDKTPPKYDIEYFQNDILADLPVIKTNNLQSIVVKNTEQVRELSWIEKPVFLWGVIVIIGLFLLFICVKMIREMKKK
ncbi:hypothetical protein [Dysgonomonas gadei]|uniref:DUF3999 domain-containing protein n=1 Tax=Dysgonomonas gadei ATCC BAA-286 TaxID=742766 RepID=F5J2K4_9BACT|nr:hypothetical protein [Dysgonomonas gadei]EGK00105.1 hypothetical protein HMPREF9455_03571 [Dysgonomonas gadei ATCC BAA-286]